MYKRFTGRLALDDQSKFKATVTIGDEILSIAADGASVGDWPLKYCRVSTTDQSVFNLWVDGEKAVFEPDEPRAFGLLAAQQFQASTLAERIGVMRSVADPLPPVEEADEESQAVPTEEEASWFAQRRVPVVAAVSLVAAISLVTLATFENWSFQRDQVPTPTTTESTAPTTEAIRTASVFTYTPQQFQQVWNRTAVDLDTADLTIGGLASLSFETALSESIVLAGLVDEEGVLSSLTLTIDPSGDAESDAMAIGAIGVAMAVADPALDGPQRRTLLGSLGLDLADPQLEGLDGERSLNGVVYDLKYLSVVEEVGSLLFIIEPE